MKALQSPGAALLALGLCACGHNRHDLWGVLHGDVTVSETGDVHGVLVWEFFEGAWERSTSADDHRCGRVLEVDGTADPSCEDCAAAATLVVTNVEHDCPAGEGTHAALAALDRLWIQPSGHTPAGSWPDTAWSWALGWSGGSPVEEGVAWDEGMEFGDPPPDPTSVVGRRVRLAPTTARGFGHAELTD